MNLLNEYQVFNKLDEEKMKTISIFCVYSKNEAIFVDTSDQVFNIINNRVFKIDILCKKKVVEFAFAKYKHNDHSHYHMLALTKDGKIYGWGCNSHNQIQISTSYDINDGVSIRQYSGVIEKHRMRTSDLFYRLSDTVILNFFSNEWRAIGKLFDPDYKFKFIACGIAHCMAVTKDNNILLWGNNSQGQLGTGRLTEYKDFIKIKIKKPQNPFKEYEGISGRRCACCMCTTGSVACCCFPLGACLGAYGLIPGLIFTPWTAWYSCITFRFERKMHTTIREDSQIKQIASGAHHNLVLFENGNLWGWGSNKKGQLGRIATERHLKPRPIFQNVKKIATYSDYTLVLCNDNVLYTMGDNTFAQLGNFDQIKYHDPIKIEFDFVDIITDNNISLGLTSDGEVYAWGLFRYEIKKDECEEKEEEEEDSDDENEHGQLLNKKRNYRKKSDENCEKSGESMNNNSIIRGFKSKAFLIDEPKRVLCNSFNEFLARLDGQTPFTIDLEKEEEIITRLPVQDYSEERPPLIEESELRIVEYNFREGQTPIKVMKDGKTYIYGDSNKFSMFDKSNVSAGNDLNISDTNFTGKSQSGFFANFMTHFE